MLGSWLLVDDGRGGDTFGDRVAWSHDNGCHGFSHSFSLFFFSFFMNVMLKPSAHFPYHINKKESLLAIKGNSAILSLVKHVLERNEQRSSLSILLTSCLGGWRGASLDNPFSQQMLVLIYYIQHKKQQPKNMLAECVFLT